MLGLLFKLIDDFLIWRHRPVSPAPDPVPARFGTSPKARLYYELWLYKHSDRPRERGQLRQLWLALNNRSFPS
jgi:hypothetical protein